MKATFVIAGMNCACGAVNTKQNILVHVMGADGSIEMGCDYYSVWYGTVMLADHMTLDNALLFIKALFEKFWNEDCAYIIKKTGCCQEVD